MLMKAITRLRLQERFQFVQGSKLSISALGGASFELESSQSGGARSLHVFLRAVPDVQNSFRRQGEFSGRILENGGRGFREASFAGDDDRVEIIEQPKLAEQRAQALVPIGDNAQFEVARDERIERWEDVLKNAPGIRLCEARIKVRKKGLAWERLDQALECGIHQFRPFGPSMIEILSRLPGRGELSIQNGGGQIFEAVAGSYLGIDVAHRRPRLDERAANVEGD